MANACVPTEGVGAAKKGGISPDLGEMETKKGFPPDLGAAGFSGPLAAEKGLSPDVAPDVVFRAALAAGELFCWYVGTGIGPGCW